MTTDIINPIPSTLWDLGAYKVGVKPTPIILVADVVNGVAESRYSALRLPGAAGGYQVTNNKTLWITRLLISSSVINTLWLLGSGTADAGDSQVAAPAGAAAEDSRADGVANPLVTQAALALTDITTLLDIAAARYPFVRNLTASSTLRVLAIAHEE